MTNYKQEKWVLICQLTLPLFSVPYKMWCKTITASAFALCAKRLMKLTQGYPETSLMMNLIVMPFKRTSQAFHCANKTMKNEKLLFKRLKKEILASRKMIIIQC